MTSRASRCGFSFLACTAVVLELLVAGAGCGRRETAVEAGVRTGTLIVGNGAEPEDLDPHITTGIPEFRIEVALFEPLVTADPETLELIPAAARTWEVSEDGLVYTFQLREDGRWSNGDPLTASDWVFSFERALTPGLGNTYLNLLRVIRGAEDFRTGRTGDFSHVGVTAPDRSTQTNCHWFVPDRPPSIW